MEIHEQHSVNINNDFEVVVQPLSTKMKVLRLKTQSTHSLNKSCVKSSGAKLLTVVGPTRECAASNNGAILFGGEKQLEIYYYMPRSGYHTSSTSGYAAGKVISTVYFSLSPNESESVRAQRSNGPPRIYAMMLFSTCDIPGNGQTPSCVVTIIQHVDQDCVGGFITQFIHPFDLYKVSFDISNIITAPMKERPVRVYAEKNPDMLLGWVTYAWAYIPKTEFDVKGGYRKLQLHQISSLILRLLQLTITNTTLIPWHMCNTHDGPVLHIHFDETDN
eukprot:gene12076-25317_t